MDAAHVEPTLSATTSDDDHTPRLRFVAELDGREGYTVSELGGKAFNLNRLVSMGARVPRGFAVKTGAYRAFTERRGLRSAIKSFVDKSKSLNLDELRSETEGLRKLFLTQPVPRGILDEIRASYSRLMEEGVPATGVSVRSSATSEDLAEASFAGLHSTFLNVNGIDEVLSSIKGCWASLWSPGAVSYRERCGFGHLGVAMGVVVQLMVPADMSGVMFTSNPVNASRSEVVINVVQGLAEKLVSGQVTPDVYVVDRESKLTLRRNMAPREGSGPPDQPAGQLAPAYSGADGPHSLTDRQIRRLVETGLRIEDGFGEPQDIEWAMTGNEIHVLQSRPIFTLLSRHDIWLQRSPAQISIEKPVIEQRLSEKRRRKETGVENDEEARYLKSRQLRSEWQGRILPRLLEEIDTFRNTDFGALPDADLASSLEEVVSANREHFSLRVKVGGLIDASVDRLEPYLSRFDFFSPEKTPMLLVGFANKDTESDEALKSLASRATPGIMEVLRRGPEALHELEAVEGSAGWAREFRSYLEDFGHLSSAKWDVMAPTYSESPGFLLDTIMSHASRETGERSYSSVVDEREDLIRRVVEALPEGERSGFKDALGVAQSNYPLKDDRDFYYLMSLAQVRRALLEAGRRLQARGVIESVDDVFFLGTDEVPSLLTQPRGAEGLRARVKARRLIFNERAQTQNEWALESSKLDHLTHEDGVTVLNGMGISPGVSTGRARIVRSFHEFPRLEAGDILVSPAVSPAWAPVLGVARGIVTDVGGALSHGGILAREYGIPAVVSTGIGTSVIKEGQTITVDGGTGRVYLHKKEGEGS